ncbi:MAG: GxxExxY protein [Elusimicrobiota bacterium]|nr:GxxExxY protein [Elusimicrobiota bacterium]
MTNGKEQDAIRLIRNREMADIIYPELSYQIMNAVFAVHNQLGPGFVEAVYENALIEELKGKRLAFEHQKTIDIIYNGKKVGRHKFDLVVEKKIILELKAVECFSVHHKAQLLSYLKAIEYRLGILVNFSKARIEYKRITNSSE